MAAINFPPNDVDPNPPSDGDTYSPPGLDTVYVYQNGVWTGSVSAPGQYLPLSGGNMTGDVTFDGDKILLTKDGNAQFSGDVDIDGNLSLGTLADVEAAIIAASGGTPDSITNGTVTLSFNGENQLQSNCDYVPTLSSAYDLGAATLRWGAIHSTSINNSNTLDNTGDVRIGGSLPNTPNIILNSTGVGNFITLEASENITGDQVIASGGIFSAPGDLSLEPAEDGFVVIGSDTANSFGAKIEDDGSIYAIGTVGVRADIPNFTSGGLEYGGGRLQISRPLTNGTDAEDVITIYNGSSATPVSQLKNDGSITLSQGKIDPSQISAAQTFTLPNKTGTIALTSDISGSGISFKGTTNVTQPAPDPVQAGDVFVNTVAGDAADDWVPIDGDAVAQNQLVFYVDDTGSGNPGWVLGGITDESEYVTLGTDQTISGLKTFSGTVTADTFNNATNGEYTFQNADSTDDKGVLDFGATTTERTYAFPDKSGTIALTDDAGGGVSISETPPTGATAGDLWWNSDAGDLFVYYDDGNSSQWVVASPDISDNYWQRNNNVLSPLVPNDVVSAETFRGDFLSDGTTTKSMASVLAGDGGGGDVTINYGGAAAWADVAADGTLNGGMNVTSVTNTGTGQYDIVFTNPMPNANYAITNTSTAIATISSKTATGFSVGFSRIGGTGAYVLVNTPFSFAIDALNAMPPQGGTGTDAWATVTAQSTNGACTVPGSFNVASVTRTAQGSYDVVFGTAMPNANYAVVTGATTSSSSQTRSTDILNKTTTGFTARPKNGANYQDYSFDFSVNAANAVLPATITSDQIAALIQNPSVGAWGNITAADTMPGSFNCSVSTSNGVHTITFDTPMPNANYSVVGSLANNVNNETVRTLSQTATSFQILAATSGGSVSATPINFVVVGTSRNGTLGGGADAWGAIAQNGDLEGTFNVDTVVLNSAGNYTVSFTNPMPNANYSVVATPTTGGTRYIGVNNKTVNGFDVVTYNDSTQATSSPFSFAVFATDGNAGGFWVKEGEGANEILQPLNPQATIEAVALTDGTTTRDMTDVVNPNADDITYDSGLGSNQVSRTTSSRLNDYVDVKDFGATGDGTTNDLAAIQNAVNYCIDNKVALYLPAGRYNCEGGTLYINHAKGAYTGSTAPTKTANGLQITGAGIMDGVSAGSTQTAGTLLKNCNVRIGLPVADNPNPDPDDLTGTDPWMMDALNIGNFTVRGRLSINTVQASSNFFNLKVLPRNSSGANGTIDVYDTGGGSFAFVCNLVSTTNFYNCLVGSGRNYNGNTLESNASGVIFKACRKINWYGGRFNNCFRGIQVGNGTLDTESEITYALSMFNIYVENSYKEGLRLAQASNCYFQVTWNGQYVEDDKEQGYHDTTTPLIQIGGVTDSNNVTLPASNVRSIRIGECRLRVGPWQGQNFTSSNAIDVRESDKITLGNIRYQRVGQAGRIRAVCEGYRLEGSDTFGSDTTDYQIDSGATPIQWGGVSDFNAIESPSIASSNYSGSNGGYRIQTTGTAGTSFRSTLNMASQQDASTDSLALKVQNSTTTAFEARYNGLILMPSLPTSATGLSAGTLYNDNGTIKVVT